MMIDKEVYRRVLIRTEEVLGDRGFARGWLHLRLPVLGFKRPINVLSEDGGEEQILTILGRIEHRIASWSPK